MSYLNRAHDPRRKSAAVAGAVVVHALIGLVLVKGLSFVGDGTLPERLKSTFIPVPPELPPPPPTSEVVPDVPKAPDIVAPKPLIDLTPPTMIQPKEFDPAVISDPVVLPRPTPGLVTPQPRPQPSFAPKRAAPRNDSSRWVVTEDYPSKAIREGAEGVAGFRVVVGSDGRVDACEITASSGNAQLDEATCKNVTRRARFEPATDGNGQKVVGSYSSTVRWELPD